MATQGPYLALGAVVVFLRLRLMQFRQPVFDDIQNPAMHSPCRATRALTNAYAAAVHASLLVYPRDLSVDWNGQSIPLVSSVYDTRNAATLATAAAVVALAGFGLWDAHRRRRKTVLLAVAMSVVPYLPSCNLLFSVGFVVAERVLYLPSMGFCVLVAYACFELEDMYAKYYQGPFAAEISQADTVKTYTTANGNIVSVYSNGSITIASFSDEGLIWNSGDGEGGHLIPVAVDRKPCAMDRHRVHAGPFTLVFVLVSLYLIRCACRTGDWDTLESIYTTGLDVHPNNEKLLFNLGRVLQESNPERSMALYTKAMHINPNYVEPVVNLGVLLLEAGDLIGGEAQFRHAIKIKPRYIVAKENLGACLLFQNKFEDAVTIYLELVEGRYYGPCDVPGGVGCWEVATHYSLLGFSQYLVDDDAGAAYSLRRSQELTLGRHPEGYLHAGLLLTKQGHLVAAADAFESAKRTSQSGSSVHAKAAAHLKTLHLERANSATGSKEQRRMHQGVSSDHDTRGEHGEGGGQNIYTGSHGSEIESAENIQCDSRECAGFHQPSSPPKLLLQYLDEADSSTDNAATVESSLSLDIFLDGKLIMLEFFAGSRPEVIADAFFSEYNVADASTASLVGAIMQVQMNRQR